MTSSKTGLILALPVNKIILVLVCLSFFAFPKAGNILWQAFIALTAIQLAFDRNRNTFRIPLLLFLLAVLVQISTWAIGQSLFPEVAEHSPKIHRLGSCFIFILVTYALRGEKRWIWAVWLAILAGAIIPGWTEGGGWKELELGLSGERIEYGFSNAQHNAMVFGFILLSLIFMARRWLNQSAGYFAIRAVTWVLLLLISLSIIALSQTRAVVLAAAIAFVASIPLYLLHLRKNKSARKIPLPLAGFIAISFMAVALAGFIATKERWQAESTAIEEFAEGNTSNIEQNSAGLRAIIWVNALDWIQQRPLTGWGGSARKQIIQSAPTLNDEFKNHIKHLHNSYLEITASYGLPALALILLLYGWIARQMWNAHLNRRMPFDIFLCGMTGMLYWLIVNLFESYYLFDSGKFIFALFFGTMLATTQAKPVPTKPASLQP